MYLIIQNEKYSTSNRVKTNNSLEFWDVIPHVENPSGIVGLFSNDGQLLCEDDLDVYEFKKHEGLLLLATNSNKQVGEDITKTPNYRLSMLEKENTDLTQHLAETDEIAIDLYEASLANEAINAEQDEAIIEIYETMEGLING